MKKSELTQRQKEEIEKFGANTWFVESLFKQYQEDPSTVPEYWKNFFGNVTEGTKDNGSKNQKVISPLSYINFEMPKPDPDDDTQVIAGSFARILDNMNNSLSIPVATSQRTIPVKLLEENRNLINRHLKKVNQGKISFTHLISWAIMKAITSMPVMNSTFSVIDGKPTVIKRNKVNLGIAIDIEKKDGSHSLIVPNIKNADKMSFKQFLMT